MNNEKILIYITVFLIMGLSNAVIPVLPELAAADYTTHGTLASSLLFSAYFIGALLTMLPFGLLSDTYGKKRFIVISMIFTAISGTMLLEFKDTVLLIFARLIEGTACGAFFPSAYSLLSEYKEKNKLFGEFNFLLNAGLATGAAISGYLAQSYIKGGVFLFTLLSTLLLIISFRKLYSGEKVRARQIKRSNNSQINELSEISNILFRKNYLRIWSSSFLLFGVTGVVLALYPDYSTGFLSKTELGIAIAGMYASSMATNIIAGRVQLHYNTMIMAGLLFAALGTVLSIYYPIPGFMLIGIGSGIGLIGLPIAVSFMQSSRGLSMGIFNTYTYAGMGLMPIIAGVLILGFDFKLTFLFSALALCLPLLMKNRLESEDRV